MMITTHLLGGLLLGSLINSYIGLPGLVVVSALGAVFPDFDMFFEHRKTFHRPFQFLFLAVAVSVASVLFANYLMLLSVFVLSAAVHSFTDILCNGKTMRPWKVKDDRAVYDHIRGKWIAPKRFFYDGSRVDLGLSFLLASVLVYWQVFSFSVAGIFFLSMVYTLGRKKIDRELSDYDRFSGFAKDVI